MARIEPPDEFWADVARPYLAQIGRDQARIDALRDAVRLVVERIDDFHAHALYVAPPGPDEAPDLLDDVRQTLAAALEEADRG